MDKNKETEINDQCNVRKLPSYKAQKLTDDNNPVTMSTKYTFKDGSKTFIVAYNIEKQEAKVMEIYCDENFDEKGKRCKTFEHNDADDDDDDDIEPQVIDGFWKGEDIHIAHVFLGDAKGSGHCSKAVSYMIKVLLLESAKVHKYPYKGHVHISSSYPCHAVNCYAHAFINNGFKPDQYEMKEFYDRIEFLKLDWHGFTYYEDFEYIFNNFRSEDQEEKYLKEEKKKNKDKVAAQKKRKKSSSDGSSNTRQRRERTQLYVALKL